MRIKNVFACAGLLVLAVVLCGAVKPKELMIESDTMTYNKKTSEVVFSGNVRVFSRNVEVKCERLVSLNFRDSAVATGKVRAYYRDSGVRMTCRRLEYTGGMSLVKGEGRVTAVKEMEDGKLMTMKSDLLEFNTKEDTIAAKGLNRKIRVEFDDVVAFADRVFYDRKKNELDLEGKPVAVKNKSVFSSENIRINTETKALVMNKGNWARVFYDDINEEAGESRGKK